MVIQTADLLGELQGLVQQHIEQATAFKTLELEQLNRRPAEGKWNALACIEHLNLYSDIYIPFFENALEKGKNTSPKPTFKQGILGKYFADGMLPREGKKYRTMDTFKKMNPLEKTLDISTINQFIHQQKQVLAFLEAAQNIDIGKVKTPTTLPLIKLKFGDSLRFYVYHNERHIRQAVRAIS